MDRPALVLPLFLLLVLARAFAPLTGHSATWDEPQHLAAGLRASSGDWRMDPEHPPLARLWASLPLVAERARQADQDPAAGVDPDTWVGEEQFHVARRLLFEGREPDGLLVPARGMILLLHLGLGLLLWAGARAWKGERFAALALLLYALEPNLLAHGALVTTDLAPALFVFASVGLLWRLGRRPSVALALLLALAQGLALLSKFSALLLPPLLLMLLPMSGLSRRRALGVAGLLLLSAPLLVWVGYGLRYAPSADPAWLFRFHEHPRTLERLPRLAPLVGALDEARLLPNAFLQGFLHGQWKAQARYGYLFGEVRTEGWWYWFPVALLLKVPLSLIVLLALGARRLFAEGRAALFLALPVLLFLGVAMAQRLNIGLRHLLPIFPFLILVAALGAAELRERRPGLLGLLLLGWVLELGRAWPDDLAFFNALAGGPRGGGRYLVDSNLDWGQDLKRLKRWMDENQVRRVNLAVFGSAEPLAYGIDANPLPGGAPHLRPGPPELPGWIAISETVLQGVYLGPAGRELYRPLREREPDARVGASIRLYRVEEAW